MKEDTVGAMSSLVFHPSVDGSESMKLICLSCGHAVDLRDAYDDYDGQVKCFACGALLAIRTREGQIKWVELVAARRPGEDPTLQGTT
jgi:DNA-directed RNA polymerase subunit N (RpoN/RPB10)